MNVLPVNIFRAALYCVRLRWQRTSETAGILFGSKLRKASDGLVHVVEKDTFFVHVHKSTSRRELAQNLCGVQRGYKMQQFYVNRRYREK